MKIYFAGSIRAGRHDQGLYFSIIAELEKYGTVLTEHIGKEELTSDGDAGLKDSYIFERDMQWIRESDVIVAEVTTPSLGVGYEIDQAQAMGKPIICIFRSIEGKKLSAMISGNSYPKVFEYETAEDIEEILREQLLSLKL